MRAFVLIILLLSILACSSEEKEEKRPVEVLREYMIAFKKGDSATMRSLLSKESVKMAEQEAQARNISLDEVIKQETLFSEHQTKVEYKNERIEGDQARVEIKTPYETWETVFFVKEDGKWKIAKEKFVEENLKKAQESVEELNRQIQEYFPNLQEAHKESSNQRDLPRLQEDSNSKRTTSENRE
ncbi:MAG: DUF4878 domain-containing protein [Acidobacteria bacterium]|jgi:hypothetical protein|nr:MAG: DUF4878 domain-containing protein [Acidobacteriota bacterium]GIU82338.1 MAG: hypothetical protein KatS3mg006_1402 [Pyrinomonadaceae bacterium]